MPNWCENKVELTITDKEYMATVVAELEKEDSDILNFLWPQPENLFLGSVGTEDEQRLAAEGRESWYSWNVREWGTKWNVNVDTWDQEDDTLTLWFDSAWGPPEAAFSNWFYTDLPEGTGYKLAYKEEGCDFYGLTIDAEDIYQGSWSEIDSIPEDFLEFLGYDREDLIDQAKWWVIEDLLCAEPQEWGFPDHIDQEEFREMLEEKDLDELKQLQEAM